MIKIFNIFFSFLKLGWKTHKKYYFCLLFSILASSATTIFSAYTLSVIVGILEKGNYQIAIIAGLVLVAIEVALAFLRLFSSRLLNVSKEKLICGVDQQIASKIMSSPFSYLEDPYYLELKKNAEMGVHNMGAVWDLLEGIAKITSSLISLIGLIAVIATFDVVLILVLAIGVVLNVVITLLMMKVQMSFYKKLLPINFEFSYYLDCLMEVKNSKDFRMYSLYDLMNTKFEKSMKMTNSYFVKIMKRISLFSSLLGTVGYAQSAFVYIISGVRTISKGLPLSKFTLVVSAAISFSQNIETLIESAGTFFRAISYLSPLMELMNIKLENQEDKEKLEHINTVDFNHVTFSYPKTEAVILDDVSFHFKKDEKISIVGLNGAGKTTIVKLICRLYQPNSGEILINGKNITEYDYDSYIEKISAIFQDYKTFAYSVKENIRPGISDEEAWDICNKVGVGKKIESLQYKLNTCLSKSYDDEATDISGGELQKIAIARSLAKKESSILIMDEPTSALDPLAEAEIYNNFNDLAKHKTAIYISHRMSSSIFCDRILVLDHGKVVDFASHDELMKKTDSLYYKLFTVQAKNYDLSEPKH